MCAIPISYCLDALLSLFCSSLSGLFRKNPTLYANLPGSVMSRISLYSLVHSLSLALVGVSLRFGYNFCTYSNIPGLSVRLVLDSRLMYTPNRDGQLIFTFRPVSMNLPERFRLSLAVNHRGGSQHHARYGFLLTTFTNLKPLTLTTISFACFDDASLNTRFWSLAEVVSGFKFLVCLLDEERFFASVRLFTRLESLERVAWYLPGLLERLGPWKGTSRPYAVRSQYQTSTRTTDYPIPS